MKPVEKNRCTGCGACSNACPKKCISMQYDEQGFLYPVVNEAECNDCGACKNSCPTYIEPVSENVCKPKVYACWINDDEARKASTSGGLFTALAKAVLDENGVVFASTMTEELEVKYVAVENEEQLAATRGSKYTQSQPGDIYIRLQEALKKGRQVLFVGCPCQIGAVYRLFGEVPEGLFTADVVCQGIASNKAFGEYVRKNEKKSKRMVKFLPRDKTRGWATLTVKHEYSDGSVKLVDSECDKFMRPYYSALFYRTNCYKCQFATIPRFADITMGDYFALRSVPEFKEELYKGISMAMLNNTRGEYLFAQAQKYLTAKPREVEEAVKNNANLVGPCKMHKNRAKFFSKDNHCLPLINIVYSPRDWKNGVYMLLCRLTAKRPKKS